MKTRYKYLPFLFFSYAISVCGQVFPVKAIMENGPRDKRINIIFVGDGYQAAEMGKYISDVNETVKKIFIENPYKEYKALFNVYAIEVPSNESGTDHPGTATDCNSLKDSVFKKDTYFDTSFDAGGIHRLLVGNNYIKLFEVMKNNFPAYDIVLMVVNHNWYGGSGGSIAVFSTNYASSEVAIHENGHSFARLADEYDYGYPQPGRYDGVNVTFRTSRDSIPWKLWIDPFTPIPTPVSGEYVSTVGLFEGAYYSSKGMFRPKMNCKMRDLGVPFCEVCIEQHVKSIFDYFELIDRHTPTDLNLELLSNEKKDFAIQPLLLPISNVSVEWFLDNNLIAQGKNNVQINGGAITIGKHNLVAVVKHNSPLVKNDPNKALQSSVKWTIDVISPTDIDSHELPIEFSLEQNYPNPFNPETTISYKVQATSKVSIKVYDVLGREVASLVNEVKPPGNYSTLFTLTSSFSSCVYFYRLQAGNFSSTKKMILSK